MKNLLKQVRDAVMASLTGMTPEQLAQHQANQQLSKSVDDFLKLHPADYLAEPKVVPARPKPATALPVTKKRVIKSLAGAGGFIPHIVDEEALRRAREAARAFQAADPDRYGDIISDNKGA